MFVPYLVKESPSQPAGDLEALEAGKTKKKVAVNPMTTCSVLFTTDHSRTGAYLGVRMQASDDGRPAGGGLQLMSHLVAEQSLGKVQILRDGIQHLWTPSFGMHTVHRNI